MFKFKNAWIYSVVTCILLVLIPVLAPCYDTVPESSPKSVLITLSAAMASFLATFVCMISPCIVYAILGEEYKNIKTVAFRKYAIRSLVATLLTILIGACAIMYFGISNNFCLVLIILCYYPMIPLPFVLMCMIIGGYRKSRSQIKVVSKN